MPTVAGSRRIVPIVVLLTLAMLVTLTPIAQRGVAGEEATFCLGFMLIFAFFLAKVLGSFALPEISGYIIAGVLCGPYAMNILSEDVVHSLQALDDVALAIIALIAGGEMRLAFLRKSTGAIMAVIAGQIVMSFVGAFAVIFVVGGRLSFVEGAGIGGAVAVALVLGLVTAARSPATTIGVVTETRSKGPFTNLVVGVTVILDVLVLVMVALAVPTARVLTFAGESFSLDFSRELAVDLAGSFALGFFFGVFIGAYIRWVGKRLPVFLVATGFIGSLVTRHYHLEPLLAFMIAGFIVQNFTVMGDKLIRGLEKSALPVYVVFFAISGASIDLDALRSMWLLAFVLVAMRAAAFYTGSILGGAVAPSVRPHARALWMGFLSQAGVTIGIASILERQFEWGAALKTLILAVVALNQLIGPVALKYILVRRGEAGRANPQPGPQSKPRGR